MYRPYTRFECHFEKSLQNSSRKRLLRRKLRILENLLAERIIPLSVCFPNAPKKFDRLSSIDTSLVRLSFLFGRLTALKSKCPFYATFTLTAVFITRPSSSVPNGVLKCVCHVLMPTTCLGLYERGRSSAAENRFSRDA